MVKETKDIPSEVLWVFALQYSCTPVGTSVFEECERIIAKYPEFFPWETKYNSIPQEVHDAYRIENNGGVDFRIMPMFEEGVINNGQGIESQIQNAAPAKQEFTLKDFEDFWNSLGKEEKRRGDERFARQSD